MKYEVKGLKNHKGHEGEDLCQCNLYRDGKKIAFFSDGDWGREAQFVWNDRAKPSVPVTTTTLLGKEYVIKASPEEAKLYDHIKDMTWGDEDFLPEHLKGEPMKMTPDIFVSELIQEYDTIRQYKKWCKKKVYFKLKDQEYADGEWSSLPVRYSPEILAKMQEKYGPNLGEVLNQRFA
jgi:hypothetical protein